MDNERACPCRGPDKATHGLQHLWAPIADLVREKPIVGATIPGSTGLGDTNGIRPEPAVLRPKSVES